MSADQVPVNDYAERVSPRLLRMAFTHLRPFCGGADPSADQVVAFAYVLALLHVADHIGDHAERVQTGLNEVGSAVYGLGR